MSVEAVYDFDPAEHYRALRAVTRLSWARWVPWTLAGVMGLYIIVVIVSGWGRAQPADLLINMMPYVLVVAFWFFVFSRLQRQAARRQAEQDPSLRGTQQRILDAAGYHSRGGGVSFDVPWHAIHRVIETEEFVLIYYTKACAYYIPKRTLPSTGISGLRETVRRAMGDRATLLA
jgi:hypothetical protein